MTSRRAIRPHALMTLVALATLATGCALSHRPDNDGGPTIEAGDVHSERGDACSHTVCGTACVDTSNDHANCGACGHACAAAEVCSGGMCGTTCAAPRTVCSGSCVDTAIDNANCGTCGHACGTNTMCSAGACVCNTGLMMCGTSCVDVMTDSMNCGACGTTCPASQFCGGGTCHVACTAPTTACGSSCVNLTNDIMNCGACGTACAFDHATPTCSGSACHFTCMTGYGDCDGNLTNGCETDLNTATDHCGTCGTACSIAHGTASCAGGHCGVGACDPGYGDCDGNASNGCETQLNSPTNCGTCRNACALAHAVNVCTSGACAISMCAANYGDCDGMVSTGCETDLRVTSTSCGTCTTACRPGETCTSSACVCPSGHTVCGTSCVDTSTDTNNCGGCGNICVANSSCVPVTGGHSCRCNSGFNWCMNVMQCRTSCP